MEKDTATTTPSTPPSSPTAAIPKLDLKGALKIETSAPVDNAPTDKYGEKLYLFGLFFCVIILVCVFLVAYLWTQSANQPQKVTTVEKTTSNE